VSISLLQRAVLREPRPTKSEPLSPLTLRGSLQDKIEVSEATLIGVTHLHQQVPAEEEIRGIARFAGKIELGRENRARRGLEADMIMPGSARIDAGENGLKLVSTVGLGELMAPAMKAGEIVLAIGVGMPKVEHRPFYGFSFPIEYKPGQGHENACNPRFTKVIFQRRIRFKCRADRFLRRRLELIVAHSRRRFQLHRAGILTEA